MYIHSTVLSSISRKSLKAKPPTFYLVVITSFNKDAESFLNDLFEAAHEKSVLNINFLSPNQNQSTWLMTTFVPFIKSCNVLQQHDIALLSDQNYSLNGPIDIIYTSNKLQDFRQCPIVAAVFHTPPFMIINSDRNDVTFNGIDTRILQHLADKFNFKLIYRIPQDTKDRGEIYPNGTVTGCIKMVHGSRLTFSSDGTFIYLNINLLCR